MRSSKRRFSAQAHSQTPLLTPHYIITSGAEVVDVGSTLLFVEQLALDYVRLNGEDVAIWLIEPDHPPRLVSFVRALVQGGAILQSL